MFIDGQWTDAARRDVFESDNPYTGKPWALIPSGTADDVDRAVCAPHRALTTGDWPKLTASKRGALLRPLGDLIAERSAHLAAIEVLDNGNLYAEMSAQCAYMAQWCRRSAVTSVRAWGARAARR
jgi:aldehyde dehydrogenase (NAD+)